MIGVPNIQKAPGAHERYQRLISLMGICEKMTARGWRVDLGVLDKRRIDAADRVARFTEMFLAQTKLSAADLGASGSGTTLAVRNWFWLDQGAPHVVFDKRTKRPQFSSECLIIYATDFAKEKFGIAAAALYGLRKNQKVLEFCESYKQFAARDGRIHFSFNPAGTQTGRWTSSTKLRVTHDDGTRTTYSANVQQVPSKTPTFDFGSGPEKLVSSLRDIFIADPGCVLLKADYDALELRLIAYVYGAKKLIGWIESGADCHMLNALGIFRELKLPATARKIKDARTDLERMANKARDAAKPVAYGVSYQMHDERGNGKYPTLFKTLKKIFPSLTEQHCNLLAQRFFDLHPEIKNGQSAVRDRIRDLGYAELSIDGRRLYYPDTPRGHNQALNFPMQGTGGALVNRALIELDKKLSWKGQEARAQIHDELVIQSPVRDREEVAAWLEEAMGQKAQIGETYAGIPAAADVGYNWKDTVVMDDFDTLVKPGDVNRASRANRVSAVEARLAHDSAGGR